VQIKVHVARAGIALDRAKILNFGCGWGRHIRFLLRDVPAENLTGTDVSAQSLMLCRSQIPGVDFDRNNTVPPLGYADSTFDVVYAQSVFSPCPNTLMFAGSQSCSSAAARRSDPDDLRTSQIRASRGAEADIRELQVSFVPTMKHSSELGDWGPRYRTTSRGFGTPSRRSVLLGRSPKYPQAVIVGRKH
jgi:hypothetical protein